MINNDYQYLTLSRGNEICWGEKNQLWLTTILLMYYQYTDNKVLKAARGGEGIVVEM